MTQFNPSAVKYQKLTPLSLNFTIQERVYATDHLGKFM